ncbi:MAG: GDP-mannose 4,6-dehydratase [Burkholderiales bacterium]|nr:GDP-mannose 4,6-dehydratase [Burkholderiales bacterium]
MSDRVLATGAGGFIGSHLVERLVREGTRVRAFVHYNSRNDWGNLELIEPAIKSEVEVVTGDVADPFSVRNAMRGVRTVYHLSSLIAIPYSYVAPQSYVTTNVQGAINVLQAAREEGVERVVHTSTSECYGTARYVPIDEAHPLQGQSPYAASKIGADMIAESYWRSFGLPVATIRPFNTFGPRQSARAVIPTIISQALKGGPIRLGALTPTRDMNYVDNTVDGFIAIATRPSAVGEVINIGSGREISIADLARLIVKLIGTHAEVVNEADRLRPAASEVERLLCNNEKAGRLTGWTPAVDLEEGLRRTIEWVARNLDRFKTHVYNV